MTQPSEQLSGLNRLGITLRDALAADAIAEKWVLAPTRRVGFAWLDAVTRSGRPVLNIRVKTLSSLALEIAAAELESQGLRFIGGVRAEMLVDTIIARVRASGPAYLLKLEPRPGLIRAFHHALRDLRLAGLDSTVLPAGSFEVAEKATEIRLLASEYEKTLKSQGLVDYEDVLRIARKRLAANADFLPPDLTIYIPADMEEGLRGLERRLWEAFPAFVRTILPVDRPDVDNNCAPTDAGILRWIQKPAEAAVPKNDGTAAIYRAVGETNEVREVVRRVARGGIAFDDVEVLYTDAETYIPRFYEVVSYLAGDEREDLPVTFAEGIPIAYSRPARALMAWIGWIQEGFPQSTIVRMIQDGLIRFDAALTEKVSFVRLGMILRSMPIGAGRDRYVAAVDTELEALNRRIAEEANPAKLEHLNRRVSACRAIRAVLEDMLCAPAPSDPKGILERAKSFVTTHVRSVSQFDGYCLTQLLDAIRELLECLDDGEPHSLDAEEWLLETVRSARVGGLGPRPGCIYVAPLRTGGHSGRKHTFVVGLDESRFPSGGVQDPILLDGERASISGELATTAGKLDKAAEEFAFLLARLRGTVTLSYCCRSLDADRAMFPSPLLLNAYRILSGNPEGDLEAMLGWLPPPASFAPGDPEACLDANEWWLWRTCGRAGAFDLDEILAARFPHLARGRKARRARESDEFTEYDGFVPEAGADFDFTRGDRSPVSASRLEKLGACPLEFFFQYVLEIEPPEEYTLDPSIWLEANERGALLHEVFRQFMGQLTAKNLVPDVQRDGDLMEGIFLAAVEGVKVHKPPPNREVYDRTVEEMSRTARIFLQEEEEFCRNSRPRYFEVSIGLVSESDGSPLDSPEPVEIALPSGRKIRARGRIDRIDEVVGSNGMRFTLWDYKTGSTFKYEKQPPFWEGRVVQHVLYLALGTARLVERHPGAAIESFGYFFPSERAHGERIQWSPADLAEGGTILERLCEMVRTGCFAFSTVPDADLKFSNYKAAFGNIPLEAENITRKLANAENRALAAFRELRGIGESADER